MRAVDRSAHQGQETAHVWVSPDGPIELWAGSLSAFVLRQKAGLHLGTVAEVTLLAPDGFTARIAEARREYADLPF